RGALPTACALGTPVVASAVGGLPEYVDDGTTGLLVPPGDAHHLAEAIVRVLADQPTRRPMERGVGRGGAAGPPGVAGDRRPRARVLRGGRVAAMTDRGGGRGAGAA